ncbi:MAG: class I SAM-dependent methyltransferase, partial [Merismopedia sp. SIO2A8]|nr:class I SAM-dependent methyltransferase [Merismopedia sp. SIO2A8]
MTSASANTPSKQKPDWAGDDFLSRVVNLLIQTKPLYQLMKQQARRVLINTAEKNGIPWRQACRDFEQSEVKALVGELTNPDVVYPNYYTVPFHVYDAGNLCWQAAFEAPSATYAMALRVWPQESLSWQMAQDRLRSSFHEMLTRYGPVDVRDVLDIGCSVGISTQSLHQYYTQQLKHSVRTVGLDLSPYMLSVAKITDKLGAIAQWIHQNAEDTQFDDASFDVVTLQFVIHELPRSATQAIFREVLRILRPGGCLAIVE